MPAQNSTAPPGPRTRAPGAAPVVVTGHGTEVRDLRPVLEAYTRNLLAATFLGQARDEDGSSLALRIRWCRDAIFCSPPLVTADPSNPEAGLAELLEILAGRTIRVGRAAGRVGANILALGKALRLTPAERAVLLFKLALRLVPSFETVTDLYGPVATGGAVDLLAAASGEPRFAIQRAISPQGTLVRSGLLVVALGTLPIEQKITVHRRLSDLVTGPRLTPHRFADVWLPQAPPPTLGLADYRHLGPAVDRLRALLAAALDRGEPGINVLLHGPTGCGKTELARLLAAELGAELRLAGAQDDSGFTPTPWERLSSLTTGDRLLGGKRTLILLDEMEDLFDRQYGREHVTPHASKAWFNRLLEANRVPTIWITNDPTGIDPAVLRRFSFALELPRLDEARRGAVWERETGGTFAAVEVAHLARRFEVSAAAISSAVRSARLIGGGRAEAAVAESLLEEGTRAATGKPVPRLDSRPQGYQAELLNASADLAALAGQIAVAWRAGQAVTMCLHGPPGTGKSEWVRYLAERLGRPLRVHRVSDIESKWVGEAEKNLAQAFEEAERSEAVLLFDEADSFLLDRRQARQRWEVTLTNEFLQRLEAARGVVACTTNTFDLLDPAVLRRFAFKVSLDYLLPAQAVRLFTRAFEPFLGPADEACAAAVEARLRNLGPLAPGDFAAVARRVPLLGQEASVDLLLRELRAEVEARSGAVRSPAGFRRE